MNRVPGILDEGLLRLGRVYGSTEDDLREEVIKFVEEHPNPEDEELHEWAEGKGYDVHEVEDVMYQLATQWAEEHGEVEDGDEEQNEDEKEDQIPGGKADDKDEDEFDEDALERGKEVEMEHTDDPELAEEIARDHLTEFPDYYDALAKMEDELKKKEGRLPGWPSSKPSSWGAFEEVAPPRWTPEMAKALDPGEREGFGSCPGCGQDVPGLPDGELCDVCDRKRARR